MCLRKLALYAPKNVFVLLPEIPSVPIFIFHHSPLKAGNQGVNPWPSVPIAAPPCHNLNLPKFVESPVSYKSVDV